MRSFFITGTDTGVGKTLLTCGLALVLKEREIPFSVWKPIETGCFPRAEDTLTYQKFLGKSFQEPLYSFSKPIAPWVASKIENRSISKTQLIKKYYQYRKEVLLLEGAGGIMVPIQKNFFMIDLAYLLKLPLILVARNRLGVLNHSLMSLQYAQSLGLHVSLFVLSSDSQEITEEAQKTNAEILQDLIFPVKLFELPWMKHWNKEKKNSNEKSSNKNSNLNSQSFLSVFRTIWDILDKEKQRNAK